MKNSRVWINYSKVRSALDFATVLNHYQIEHPSGKTQIKVRCPFHEEKTPSMSIHTEDGKFHCFGCGAKGNTLEFVIRKEGKNPDDKDDLYQGALLAIAMLGREPADFTKRGTPRNAPESTPAPQKVEKRPESRPAPQTPPGVDSGANKPAPKPKENPVLDLKLPLDPKHPFLAERGITPEVAEAFGLGYCAKGIMNERIAIPIHNERGELVAYAGRYAKNEVPEGTLRYRLPKTFLKSLVLFNLHRAREFEKRHVVIVEGFWSAIRLHRALIPAVALMGTSCSREQAVLLRNTGFRFATLLLDGDDAGRKATPEILATLAKCLYVRTVELADGEKPDTLPDSFLDGLR